MPDAVARQAMVTMILGLLCATSWGMEMEDSAATDPSVKNVATLLYPALSVDGDIFIGEDSHLVKGGKLLLTDDFSRLNTALGRMALSSGSTGIMNTALGTYALRFNTYGMGNTAVGAEALHNNVGVYDYYSICGKGCFNTAVGAGALMSNSEGVYNTAVGYWSLKSNTTGDRNVAVGRWALRHLGWDGGTGDGNVAVGSGALQSLESGSSSTVIGHNALIFDSSGHSNIAIGAYAGWRSDGDQHNILIGHEGISAGESHTIRLGTPYSATYSSGQKKAFIAGIRGTTTGLADVLDVKIDSQGQLGTTSSSRRVKEDIRRMHGASSRLLALRPVTFRFRRASANGDKPLQFGLIAEEVAEVFPELVVYDSDGQPEAVKYHLLSPLLLNELQKQQRWIQVQSAALVFMMIAGTALMLRRRST